MAQKTVVTVTCDMHDDEEIEGAETLTFALDGTSYEIDVCDPHAKDLRDRFGDITEHARRVSSSRALVRRHRTSAVRDRSTDIRAWAKEHGHAVSERGRIPQAVVAEYESAH